MSPTDAKVRAAELRIPFDVAESHYQREREIATAAHERGKCLRSAAVGHYGSAAAFYSRFRRGDGDHSKIPQFDVWAASLATEYPDLLPMEDPAATLWTFLQTPADRLPSAADLWDRAFAAAVAERGADDLATADDFIPVSLAAELADVSPFWVRCLAKDGKIPSRRLGRSWIVSKTAVLAFVRHPTAGRPRRGSSLPADVPF
jgi:hypothetical protein